MAIAWKAYAQLTRPANVVTAISDVIAGSALATLYLASGDWQWPVNAMLLVCVSTVGLYAGGVVFNDVFDAKLDAVERPERPIPSGRVSLQSATWFGMLLFAIGVGAAAAVGLISGLIAAAIVLSCLVYDKWAKHHVITGPIVMGLCRGLNLLLGISVFAEVLPQIWALSCIPIVYVAAITVISRGEVHGGKRLPLLFAGLLYALVIVALAYFGIMRGGGMLGIVIMAVFALMIFVPLVGAIRTEAPGDIRKSVKNAVLALIFMNAVWVAASGFWPLAVLVLLLFPLSVWLAKQFAVT